MSLFVWLQIYTGVYASEEFIYPIVNVNAWYYMVGLINEIMNGRVLEKGDNGGDLHDKW